MVCCCCHSQRGKPEGLRGRQRAEGTAQLHTTTTRQLSGTPCESNQYRNSNIVVISEHCPPIDVALAQNKQPSPGPPATADGRKVAAAAAPPRSEPTSHAISLICGICRTQGPLLASHLCRRGPAPQSCWARRGWLASYSSLPALSQERGS